MAVPKRRVSKTKGNTRFANWKLTTPNLSECPQCHELIDSHTVCPACGYYKGVQVVTKKVKEEK